MNRRRFLDALIAGGGVGFAGCSGSESQRTPSTATVGESGDLFGGDGREAGAEGVRTGTGSKNTVDGSEMSPSSTTATAPDETTARTSNTTTEWPLFRHEGMADLTGETIGLKQTWMVDSRRPRFAFQFEVTAGPGVDIFMLSSAAWEAKVPPKGFLMRAPREEEVSYVKENGIEEFSFFARKRGQAVAELPADTYHMTIQKVDNDDPGFVVNYAWGKLLPRDETS